MNLIAVDTETFPIGAPDVEKPGVDIFPKLVCSSMAWRGTDGKVYSALYLPWEDASWLR